MPPASADIAADPAGTGATGPVTVVVRRTVRPGCDAAYEAWLARLVAEARGFEGYQGSTITRPGPGSRVYVSVFRFSSPATLAAFERSDLRARALAEVAPLVEADAAWDRLTGLELWFEAPPGTRVPVASPHRMAVVLVAVVYVLVLALNLSLGPLIGGWPMPLRLFVTATVQVLLMTYLIMPRLTRHLARWIFPATRTT